MLHATANVEEKERSAKGLQKAAHREAGNITTPPTPPPLLSPFHVPGPLHMLSADPKVQRQQRRGPQARWRLRHVGRGSGKTYLHCV